MMKSRMELLQDNLAEALRDAKVAKEFVAAVDAETTFPVDIPTIVKMAEESVTIQNHAQALLDWMKEKKVS